MWPWLQHEAQTIVKAKQLLRMPPYFLDIPEEPEILENNPKIAGFSDHKHLFIDISESRNPTVRLVKFSNFSQLQWDHWL